MVWLGKFCFCVLLVLPSILIVSAAVGTLRINRELPYASSSSDCPWAGGMVIVKSRYSFDETYNNLKKAIPAEAIVAEIDHAAGAASVDLELLPNKLVIVANPALGTPIMQQNLLSGLDLPQKFLVWQQHDCTEEEKEQVFVGYNPPEYIVARYEDTENAKQQLVTMSNALSNFASLATGVDSDYILHEADNMRFPSSRSHNGVLSIPSNDDFETTLDRLLAALNADGGPNIAFEVDHAANSDGALRENSSYLVVFGNPTLGTPLIQASPTTGIDLPLKILITQHGDDDMVYVTTNMIGYLQHRHNLWSLDDELTTVQNALLTFVGIATNKNITRKSYG